MNVGAVLLVQYCDVVFVCVTLTTASDQYTYVSNSIKNVIF